MKVLALDIATKTGWSVPELSGVIDLKPELEATGDWGRITHLFHGQVSDLMAIYSPDKVAIEAPINRGSNTRLLFGLVQTAHAVAHAHQIPRLERSIQSIKKFATGKPAADKLSVLEAVRAKGIECKTNDEADAIALRLLVESEI